ncbi:MAG: carbamate kinase [Lactobacillales bacterium]|jgi:carbamate kinase|nr:carbamate kinase [Lactobacillales bacterium]
MSQKIVVALGGNAILTDDPTARGQQEALKKSAYELVKLIENGDKLVISHGNGPQVGNLLLQQMAADEPSNPAMPLDTCVAMTEGAIGYWLQNALDDVLAERGVEKETISLVTQVVVDPLDPSFQAPSKPIGPFLSKEACEKQAKVDGATYKEDAGRGWRKVVASPKPITIREASTIRKLIEDDVVTISVGGGGIPVIKQGGKLIGVEAVIDKDFSSEKLAEEVGADKLIILTGVDNVYINYGKPNQEMLSTVTISQLEEYIKEGQFAPGSMLPKVQAAIQFVSHNPLAQAVISSLENIESVINDGAGTVVVAG